MIYILNVWPKHCSKQLYFLAWREYISTSQWFPPPKPNKHTRMQVLSLIYTPKFSFRKLFRGKIKIDDEERRRDYLKTSARLQIEYCTHKSKLRWTNYIQAVKKRQQHLDQDGVSQRYSRPINSARVGCNHSLYLTFTLSPRDEWVSSVIDLHWKHVD